MLWMRQQLGGFCTHVKNTAQYCLKMTFTCYRETSSTHEESEYLMAHQIITQPMYLIKVAHNHGDYLDDAFARSWRIPDLFIMNNVTC